MLIDSGKTTKLIELSANTGAYIVCFNMEEADRVYMQAKKMGLKIPFPIIFDEIDRGDARNSHSDVKYLLDNADLFLQRIFCGKLLGLSVTKA